MENTASFQSPPAPEINVDSTERAVSAILGAVLFGVGVGRRGILGGLSMLSGAALLDRGIRGHCAIYGALGVSTAGIAQSDRPLRAAREFSVTIDAPADAISKHFATAEELSLIIGGAKASRAEGIDGQPSSERPGGLRVRILGRTPDRIDWTAEGGLDGYVTLKEAPGHRGTEVHFALGARRPDGWFNNFASWLSRFRWQARLRHGLRQLKQEIEAHDIPSTAGQPSGRQGGRDSKPAMTLAEAANKI
jgi:uncharacterized membrane protein